MIRALRRPARHATVEIMGAAADRDGMENSAFSHGIPANSDDAYLHTEVDPLTSEGAVQE
jgi:hypothetical protein